MNRVEKTAPSSFDILTNLVRATSYNEAVVQIGASVEWPGATTHQDLLDRKIGLLHLGVGCHGQFEVMMPYLAKGAIILMEGYSPDGPAYNYAIDQAAKGYLSSLSEARHWRSLGVATYLGGAK